MKIAVITIFPNMFKAIFEEGVIARARKNKLFEFSLYNPRDYSSNKHNKVDDRPYGGGPGMVMLAQPLYTAIQAAKEKLPNAKVIYLSPQGKTYSQSTCQEFANYSEIILIAGRYAGIDERIISTCIDYECSIGDYILSGGELPAMVLIDSIVRMLPGCLGCEESNKNETHSSNNFDYPYYTKPEVFNNKKVPDILLSGNHTKIEAWRKEQAKIKQILNRPDTLENK